jgi:hypothetical protein
MTLRKTAFSKRIFRIIDLRKMAFGKVTLDRGAVGKTTIRRITQLSKTT